MEFKDQVAIVTGAASGMGLLMSQEWARLGGKVVMADVNAQALQASAAELNEKYGLCAVGAACDVRDYAQVCAVRDLAVETFGRIDLLVNCAGGTAVRLRQGQTRNRR